MLARFARTSLDGSQPTLNRPLRPVYDRADGLHCACEFHSHTAEPAHARGGRPAHRSEQRRRGKPAAITCQDDLLTLSFREDCFDLLVIDTAVRFPPLGERNKKTLGWALAQLSLVAGSPAGVLILNQSRNVQRPLAAFVDIVIEMAIPRGLGPTRRRTFTGVGRYPGTLGTVSAELNAEGTDYLLLPDGAPPCAPLLATLEALLGASPVPLTCRELLARWPNSPPRADSLWRALARGVERGLFIVEGAGTKTDAFRYGLASPSHPPEPGA